MYGLSIEVNTSGVTEALAESQRALADDRLKPVMGRAVVNLIKGHLVAYDSSHPNAFGAKRTHFYAAAGRAASFQVQPWGVLVGISHTGIAQRFFGGTIKPIPPKKLLTIPANADAYGRRAGEFNNLELIGNRKYGFLALVERQATAVTFGRVRKDGTRRAKAKATGGRIMFWLVPQVVQRGDPDVLPTADTMAAEARNAALAYLQQLAARRAA
jgi:hypothetical protein